MTKRQRALLILGIVGLLALTGAIWFAVVRPDMAAKKTEYIEAAEAYIEDAEKALEEGDDVEAMRAYDAAVIEYRNLVKIDSQEADSHMRLASVYKKAAEQKRKMAKMVAEKLYKTHEENPALTKWWYLKSEIPNVEEEIEKLKNEDGKKELLDSTMEDLRGLKAQLAELEKNKDEIEDFTAAAREHGERFEKFHDISTKADEYTNGAVRHFYNSTIQADSDSHPDVAEAHIEVGEFYHKKAARSRTGRDDLKKIAESIQSLGSAEAADKARALVWLGECAVLRQDYEEAYEHLDAATETDDSCLGAYITRSALIQVTGEPEQEAKTRREMRELLDTAMNKADDEDGKVSVLRARALHMFRYYRKDVRETRKLKRERAKALAAKKDDEANRVAAEIDAIDQRKDKLLATVRSSLEQACKLYPTAADLYQFRSYIERNTEKADPALAEDYLRKAISRAPGKPEAHIELSNLLFSNASRKPSEESIARAREARSGIDFALALMERKTAEGRQLEFSRVVIKSLIDLRQFEDAENELEQARAMFVEHNAPWLTDLWRGYLDLIRAGSESALKSRHAEAATRRLRRAISAKAETKLAKLLRASALEWLGRAYLLRQMPVQAEARLEEAVKLKRSLGLQRDPLLAGLLAEVYYRTGHEDKIATVLPGWQPYVGGENVPSTTRNMQMAFLAGDLDGCARHAKALLEKDARNERAHQFLMAVALKRAGTARTEAINLRDLGRTVQARKRSREAESLADECAEVAEQWLAAMPESPTAMAAAGWAFGKRRQFSQADKWFEKALASDKLGTDEVDSFCDYAFSRSRPEYAVELLTELKDKLEKNNDDARLIEHVEAKLAQARIHTGEIDKVISIYQVLVDREIEAWENSNGEVRGPRPGMDSLRNLFWAAAEKARSARSRAVKIQRNNPPDLEEKLDKAEQARQEGYGIAREAMEKMKKFHPESPKTLYIEGRLAMMSDDLQTDERLEKAEKSFEKSLDIEPNAPVVLHWYSLAIADQGGGRLNEAVRAAERACELNPRSVDLLRELAQLYIRNGREERALETYEEILKRHGEIVDADIAQAALMWQRREVWSKAESRWRWLVRRVDDREVRLRNRLERVRQEGKSEKMIARYQDAHEKALTLTIRYRLRLSGVLSRRGRASKVDDTLAEVTERLESAPEEVVFETSAFLNSIGRTKQARDIVQDMMKAPGKDELKLLPMLARHFWRVEKRPDKAEEKYKEWMNKAPEDVRPLLAYGRFLRERAGAAENAKQRDGYLMKALDVFQKASRIRRSIAVGNVLVGTLIELERWAEAFLMAGDAARDEIDGTNRVEQFRVSMQMLVLARMWAVGKQKQAKELLEGAKLSGRTKLVLQARIALLEGRSEKARQLAERALEDGDRFPAARRLLGSYHMTKGNELADAGKELRRRGKTVQADHKFQLARDHWALAKSEADSILRKDPDSLAARLLKGQAEYRQGDFRSCIETFEPIRRWNAQAQYMTAVSMAYRKEYGGAERLLEASLRTFPDNPEILLLLATVQKDIGKLKTSEKAFLKYYEASDKGIGALGKTVRPLLDMKSFSLAEEKCREFLKLHPENGKAVLMLIDTFARQERSADAEDIGLKAVEDVESPVVKAQIWTKLGETRRNEGRLNDAIVAFTKAIEISKNMPGAWVGLGAAQLQASDIAEKDSDDDAAAKHADEAIRTFRRVMKLAPDNVFAANNLAWLLGEKGDFEEASDVCQRIIDQDRATSALWDTYGYIKYQSAREDIKDGRNDSARKRLIEAKEALVASLNERPNNVTTQQHLNNVGQALDALPEQ